ncbi:MAG: hypothetical protein Tsb0034_01280 [Ekhidna sp.]
MSYKPEESTWIAYLYGELSGAEKNKVEEYLSSHLDARKEIEGIKETLGILGNLQDKEIPAPEFVFDQPSKVVVGSSIAARIWKKSLAIAASIVLVLLAGYFTKMNLSISDGKFQVAFGDTQTGYSKNDVEQMIAAAVNKSKHEMQGQLAATESRMLKTVSEQAPAMDKDEIEAFLARHQGLSADDVSEMIKNMEQAQQEYTDRALQDLAIFLDIQRQGDLEVIQAQFENFENNAVYNQLQTNQLLTNLISSVEDRPDNQY